MNICDLRGAATTDPEHRVEQHYTRWSQSDALYSPACSQRNVPASEPLGRSSRDLLPFRINDLAAAVCSMVYAMRPHGHKTICSPLWSICERPFCAPGAQVIEFELEKWRRRPDLNRRWRFCRFSGVVNGVVSCWSLVSPAPSFCLV